MRKRFAPVAQLDRALVFGTRCRRFKSCRVRHLLTILSCHLCSLSSTLVPGISTRSRLNNSSTPIERTMKRLIASVVTFTLCSFPVFGQQTTARIKGTVLDTAGMPIPKIQITVQNSTVSFNTVSDEDGKFQIDLPPGTYELRSDKLPGFAATKRNLSVGTNQTAEVTIVPAVSEEGVLCILRVTSGPTKKPKRRQRHR